MNNPQQQAQKNIETVSKILGSELNEMNTEAAENLLREALIIINTIRTLEGWKHGNNINIESRLHAVELAAVILAEMQGLPMPHRSVEEDVAELAALGLAEARRRQEHIAGRE